MPFVLPTPAADGIEAAVAPVDTLNVDSAAGTRVE